MLNQLIDTLKKDEGNWARFQENFIEKKIPVKTILLKEGEIANRFHFVKKGCLRMWFNKDGKDITLQFFFEGQVVASIDSLLNNQPSMFTVESIEPSTIVSIDKSIFEQLHQLYPKLRDAFQKIILLRFNNYAQLFLSRIKDSPRERYNDILHNQPEIIRRVPQHYIASYLGISPISLSRIKNRK